jgi:hypothetical protein
VPGIGASGDEAWSLTPDPPGHVHFRSGLRRATSITSLAKTPKLERSRTALERPEKFDQPTIFDDVHQARVWLYEYPPGVANRTVEGYARSFLQEISAFIEKKFMKHPLHLAAHSTGGLVIKHALISEDVENSVFVEACFSIAFFGTPRKLGYAITGAQLING